MPRVCTVCTHTERQRIDEALVTGTSFRKIAERFGTSTTALYRHKQDHVPGHLAKAQAAEEVAQADDLLARLLLLNQETLAILREARTGHEKDNELALKAIARAEKQLELQGKLVGKLQDHPTVNVLVLPAWQMLRTTIFVALAPYPEARVAVAEALHSSRER